MHLLTKAPVLLGLIAVCAALLLAPAAAAPTSLGADFRGCSDISSWYVNEIRVKRVACPQAKRVIKRYTRLMNEKLQHDWSLTVLGFDCDLTGKDFYGDSHRCTAGGGRMISFRRGT
jgi:hypothetical protein